MTKPYIEITVNILSSMAGNTYWLLYKLTLQELNNLILYHIYIYIYIYKLCKLYISANF